MTELVIVRAADEAALLAETRRIVGYLDRAPGAALADVAYTCSFLDGPAVLSVVADSVADLRARLASAADRIAAGTVARIRDKSGTYWFREHMLGPGRGKLAFVYPGVTAYYPDMLRDLAILHPVCREAFDELEEALAGGAFSPSSFIFPPAPRYRRDADVFRSGAYAQALVATYSACAALTRLMAEDGVRPDGVVGFAGGDLAAMVRSGVTRTESDRGARIRMLRDIYAIVDKAVSHGGFPAATLVSVLFRRGGDDAAKALASLPEGAATLAIDVSPRQKTYVVRPEQADAAIAAFAAAGGRAFRLPLDRPFNTPLCEPLVPAVRKFTDAWMRHDPTCEVYSCALAAPLPERLRKARAETAERWARPVRFADTVRRMHADGYRVFLEVGPQGLLASAVDDALGDAEHAAIALNSSHRRDMLQLQHAIAWLAALGASVDVYKVFMRRGARKLDFDSSFAATTRRETEMTLSRAFPRLVLPADGPLGAAASPFAEPRGRGAKAARRAAIAEAAEKRRQRQFDFGALNPLVSDADVVRSSPGVEMEIRKTFTLADAPFLGDFAVGASRISYGDENLRGLVLMTLPLAAEVMAETAAQLCPNMTLVAIEGLTRRRVLAFTGGSLSVTVSAERVASGNPDQSAVLVRIRDAKDPSEYTWAPFEATVVLARHPPEPQPVRFEPLTKPRAVHWLARDIYPVRLSFGERLRGIVEAEAWSESGLDYEVETPDPDGCVRFTRFPLWLVDPILLQTIVSGFALWRSHERFSVWRGTERMDDAYSFPFRLRRLTFHAPPPSERASLRCYLRLTGVTPKTHLCDIAVSDGDGGALMTLSGWEEYVEHVRSEYRALIQQPGTSFISRPLDRDFLGAGDAEASAAVLTDIPYAAFQRDDEIWLKAFANVVLGAGERGAFEDMTGSTDRRTEWLFGRIAAKESVRRFLVDYHQARWACADVAVHPDDKGKPKAYGKWQDDLDANVDVAIAHTSAFVIAVAVASRRVGVDVERVGRDLSAEFANGVFSEEELALAARAGRSAYGVIRFWCAKEAVSKALGTGIRYSPKELVVTAYDDERGIVTVRLEGAWADAFRKLRGRDVTVTVRTMNDHALAFCFLPEALVNAD